MSNIDRLRKGLSPDRKRKIAARAATIIAEERSLQELRRAHKLTQKKMAEALGVGQASQARVVVWTSPTRRRTTRRVSTPRTCAGSPPDRGSS